MQTQNNMAPSSNTAVGPGRSVFSKMHTLDRVAPAALLHTTDTSPANTLAENQAHVVSAQSFTLPHSVPQVPHGRNDDEGDDKEAEDEQGAESDNEVWTVNAGSDRLGIELWVPPAKQNRFRSVQVRVATDGTLGIEFRCPAKHNKPRRRTRQRQDSRRGRRQGHPPPRIIDNGIQVVSFDEEQNPHVGAVEAVVPIGSTLQLWDGEPVESPVKFANLVARMRQQHFLRQRDDNDAVDLDQNACDTETVVTLTFAVPLLRLS
eukprot:INCI2111.1.p1 GENE.INCI2111.1~~INCI2111.1.p1  ORF type:complete len:262 (-),score=34.93 INCI2111.1:45-830(-)